MSQRKIAPTFNDLDSLFRVVDHLRMHLDRELEQNDLTAMQVQALMFIARVSGGSELHCTAASLEAHLGLAKATNQHLVKRLKERGLVGETADGLGDLRRKQLCLTKDGEKALASALDTWKHGTKRAIRALDASLLSELRSAARAVGESPQRLHRLFKLEDNADWKYQERHVVVGDSDN